MLLNRERAERVMEQHGLEALVATTTANAYYLSDYSNDPSWGFGGMFTAVLPLQREKSPAVITSAVGGAMEQHGAGPWMPVRLYGGAANPWNSVDKVGAEGYADLSGFEPLGATQVEATRAYLGELGLLDASVGVDDPAYALELASGGVGPRFRAVPVPDLFREVRMVKTGEELRLLRSASRKTRLALEAGIEAIAAGGTALECERTFWASLSLMGCQPMFLLTMPYRPGTGRLPRASALRRGDLVTFDAVSGYRHYHSDLGRTAVIGQPSAAQLDAIGAIRRGWERAKAEVGPGMKSEEVRQLVLDCVRREGSGRFNSGGIHCVGLEHDDQPRPLSGPVPFTLEADMVVSVDMPYLDTGVGQFHSEELVVVRPGGLEDLNGDNRLYVVDDGEVSRAG